MHVALTFSIDIDDAEAVVAAGRRSYARDLVAWRPGVETPTPGDDAAEAIPDIGQALTDLFIEAWVRCYGRNGLAALIEQVDSVGDIDVINREVFGEPWPDGEDAQRAELPTITNNNGGAW